MYSRYKVGPRPPAHCAAARAHPHAGTVSQLTHESTLSGACLTSFRFPLQRSTQQNENQHSSGPVGPKPNGALPSRW